MPKIVDHDHRRLELANAAARIAAEKGLDNTTVRDIAREAGFTSGILAHYFRDKNDILGHTLRLLDERTAVQFTPALSSAVPLEEVLLQGLLLDEQRAVDSRIRVHFWARALSSPELAEQQALSFRSWIRSTRALLRSRQKSGELDATVRLEPLSEVVTALVIGVGVMALFLPERARRAFVRRVIGTAARALL